MSVASINLSKGWRVKINFNAHILKTVWDTFQIAVSGVSFHYRLSCRKQQQKSCNHYYCHAPI
jgi:hypothetical protein